jgi:parvulin-like peptidyl-prolyl isomerase
MNLIPLVLLLSFPVAQNQEAAPAQTTQILDQVVAVAGQAEITLKDVRAEVNRIIPVTFFHARMPEDQKMETYRKALDNLIERALIHQGAQARGITASEQEIRAEFKKTLQQAGPQYANISADKFTELLEGYRPKVVRRILIDKNNLRFESTLKPIADAEIKEVYEAQKSHLLAPVEARFLHILRKVDPAAGQEEGLKVRTEMQDLLEQLANGADFKALAKQHSEDIFASTGGDMGFIQQGALRITELNQAAFALKDGETSELLTSLYGFHILRRVESRPPRQLTLEEAAAGLKLEIASNRRNAARAKWLEQLKKELGVEELVTFTSKDG